VEEFLGDLAAALTSFYETGPASPNVELPNGLELMKSTNEQLGKFKKKRDELVKTQKLFDLEITVMADLGKMQVAWDTLNEVYILYEAFIKQQAGWSQMLFFGELDMKAVDSEMAKKTAQATKLPAPVREFAAAHKLDIILEDFTNSLPLITG
jgi:hypothetical protein